MATDVETIKKIAQLSALSINESELEGFAKDLDMIIGYMEQLSKLDTGDVKPMEHVLPLHNVLREDVPTHVNRREELMNNAPETANECFMVPSVVDA
jgi:aspartyl-tRNA(Asn)/glutamyl-tRNA(Gln) amidotransferase subunit C